MLLCCLGTAEHVLQVAAAEGRELINMTASCGEEGATGEGIKEGALLLLLRAREPMEGDPASRSY